MTRSEWRRWIGSAAGGCGGWRRKFLQWLLIVVALELLGSTLGLKLC